MDSQLLKSNDKVSLVPTNRDRDSDDGKDSNLPEHAPNSFSYTNLPVLVLILHGRPPLNPPARLSFDIRSLENPPKHIRDSHNGTSKRLQEWMRQNSAFIVRRDAIASEIQAAMAEFLEKEGEDLISKSAESDEITASEEEELPTSFEPGFRVGINCQMGRHRSVAMVEELAKMSWPGWDIRIEHRDIKKKRRDNEKKGRRDGLEQRVNEFGVVFGED